MILISLAVLFFCSARFILFKVSIAEVLALTNSEKATISLLSGLWDI